jgi:chromosome partitioning protein
MKTLIFVNQKGGSGKSILSYNMAHYLADLGKRVLFIDGDEQMNSSKSLAMYWESGFGASALFDAETFALPEMSENGITLLHGDTRLRTVEKSGLDDGELVMRLQANLFRIAERFDFAVIDTAGANSRVANALLIASDYCVLPCRIDPYSIDVATQVLKRVVAVQKSLNPNLVNLGILPNEVDGHYVITNDWLKQLTGAYPQFVMGVSVPKRIVYREACTAGVPVWRLRSTRADGSAGAITTSARAAGREVHAVFDILKAKMDAS